MANYSNLKNIIDQVVRTNGQGDITGANLNQTLQQMVTDLGANYQYAGVATPSTNPGSPDQNVFYIATLAGTYSYFNGIVLPKGITVLRWNGSWSSTTLFTVDTGLTPYSEALVQSGTVFEKFKFDGGPWDVSAHFPTAGPDNDGRFTLDYILTNANTLIPEVWRKGGMSIGFISSYDNKYVQYFLRHTLSNASTAAADFANTANWEKMNLEKEVNELSNIELGELVSGEYISSSDGSAPSVDGYYRTDFLYIENISKLKIYVGSFVSTTGAAFYSSNSERTFVSGINFSDFSLGDIVEIDVPSDAKYFRICAFSLARAEKMFVAIASVPVAIQKTNGTIDGIKQSVLTLQNNLTEINLGTLVDGFVNSAYGEFVEATSYKRTDYLRINATKIRTRITYSVSNVGIAFYDRNKRYIGGSDAGGTSIGGFKDIVVPDGTYYFATCAINAQVPNMLVLNMELGDIINHLVPQSDNPCFYDGSSEARTFKKVLCIGDSLTEGRFDYTEDGVTTEFTDGDLSWPAFFAAIAGRKTTNKGDAGQTTKTWWQLHQNDDLSGHDACIIALGRNDYVPGRETTSEERIQYMTNIVNKVKEENPQIKIFISTMLNYYTGASADAVNADMRTIAGTLPDCYLVDISAYGKLIAPYDRYSHCTAVGYQKLGEYYFRYLSYIMINNPTDFKNVQFVGTNRTYNP